MHATCAAHTLQAIGLHNNLKFQIHSVFRPVHLVVPSDSKVSVVLSNANLLRETEETGLYCKAHWLLHVPQSECVCFVWISERRRLFPYTALTVWFV